MIRRRMLLAGWMLGLLLWPAAATASGERIFTRDGVALGGTDPVAYFTEGKPVRGSPDHAFEWKGAVWHFASAANRDRFAADPERHAPRYGGWCAWAAAEGYAAETAPDAWQIVDGRLYLNYSRGIHRRWQRDIPGHIEAADRNWPNIFNRR